MQWLLFIVWKLINSKKILKGNNLFVQICTDVSCRQSGREERGSFPDYPGSQLNQNLSAAWMENVATSPWYFQAPETSSCPKLTPFPNTRWDGSSDSGDSNPNIRDLLLSPGRCEYERCGDAGKAPDAQWVQVWRRAPTPAFWIPVFVEYLS